MLHMSDADVEFVLGYTVVCIVNDAGCFVTSFVSYGLGH